MKTKTKMSYQSRFLSEKAITKCKKALTVFLAAFSCLLLITNTQANNLRIASVSAATATVAATTCIAGNPYTIVALGTTNFTLIGAASNTVGLVFTATGVGAGTGTVATGTVTFDIAWDNSWWTSTGTANYDAVWVFLKSQTCQYPTSATTLTPAWNTVLLSTVSAQHTVGTSTLPITIDAVTDGMGVFIHQTSAQLSNQVSATVTLRVAAGTAALNWKVFGIEMVNIPTAAFSVGDGSGTTTNPFNDVLVTPGNPFSITTDNAIGAGALYTGSPVVPLAYPVGYTSFYCMKQEISQSEYANFLNSLSYDQQVNRTANLPNLNMPSPWALTAPAGGPYNRNGIKVVTAGVNNFQPAVYASDFGNNNIMDGANDGQDIACNYLSWADVAAYLDWAALRPMTELEYEKVCRGTVASSADEYPWGTTNLTAAVSTALFAGSAGTVSEYSTARPASGLCVYNNATATEGPIRGGASTTSSSTRVTAAAAYYGSLDMAGNVWEQVVSVNTAGVLFIGSLGNGALTTTGNATNTDWPGIDATPANGVTGGAGSGSRGGSWYTQAASATLLRTSDRTNATTPNTTRSVEHGGRGVR